MMKYIIRKINPPEYNLLEKFLYEAIFQREGIAKAPKTIINEPDLKIYIEDFGKESDYCLVAEVEGEIIGAVWTRVLSGKISGFGNIDDDTPEFAISVLERFRNNGIGTALMKEMLGLVKSQGYKQTSLAVQKDNYAVRMYKDVGFTIVDENEEEYIMICKL